MPKVSQILLNTLLSAGIALNPTDVRATDEKNNTSQSESSRNTIRLVSTPTFTPSTLDFSSIDFKDSSHKNVQKEKIAQMLGIFENTTKLRVRDTSRFIHQLYLEFPRSNKTSETKNVANYFQRLAWLHTEGLLDQEMFDVITNCPNQTAISVALNRLILLNQNIQNGSVNMNIKDYNVISARFLNDILDYACKPSPKDFTDNLTAVNAIAGNISKYLLI